MRVEIKNALFAAVGVVVALAICEVGLRSFLPQPVDYFYFEEHARPNSISHRWGIEIKINSHGYRDYDHSFERPVDSRIRRIEVLGDSITYGTGVAFEDIYHQKLKKLLDDEGVPAEVIALNQGATSTDWALRTYLEVGRKYKPDLVVLGFCLNDFQDYELPHGQNGHPSLVRRFYDLLAEVHQRARILSHLYFFVFERSRRFFYQNIIDRTVRTQDSWVPMNPDSPKNAELFARQLESTVAQIRKLSTQVTLDGAKFLVIIFPFEMQLTEGLSRMYAEEYRVQKLDAAVAGRAQELLGAELSRYKIPYVDLLPAFRHYAELYPNQQIYFRELGGMLDWAHPNAVGHQIAAEAISPAVWSAIK